MTMMDLFSPACIELEDGSASNRLGQRVTLSESKDDDDEICYDGDDDDLSSSSPEMTDTESSQDSSVARKVCRLWRKRRRQEKEKIMRLRQESGYFKDKPTTSSTTNKTISITIHRNNKPYDEVDEMQRLEKHKNAISSKKILGG
jgi:hypothetical protein